MIQTNLNNFQQIPVSGRGRNITISMGYPLARTGAVTLIQRFGSALNLNIRFHMLFQDGIYVEDADGKARFRWVKAPTSNELN